MFRVLTSSGAGTAVVRASATGQPGLLPSTLVVELEIRILYFRKISYISGNICRFLIFGVYYDQVFQNVCVGHVRCS